MRYLPTPTLFSPFRSPFTALFARTLVLAVVIEITHCWPSQPLVTKTTTASNMAIVTRRRSQRQLTQRLQYQTNQQNQQPLVLIPGPVQPLLSLSSTNLDHSDTEEFNIKKRRSQPVTPSPKKIKKAKASKSSPKKVTKLVKDSTSLLSPNSSSSNSNSNSNSNNGNTAGILTSVDVAAINPGQPFLDLNVGPNELRPSATLTTGQCFHWKAVTVDLPPENITSDPSLPAASAAAAIPKESAWGSHNATEWIGTLRTLQGDSIAVVIRETPTTTLYRPLTELPNGLDLAQFLYTYFQLKDSLVKLYHDWSKSDQRLAIIAKCIPGVRIIQQDPWECLISFICSSNNNIPRITKMLSAIRQTYGQPLVTIGGTTRREDGDGDEDGISLYSFPSLEDLAQQATDADLRNICGLGYRSKYIIETIRLLQELGGEPYLHQLRMEQDPTVVQEALCQFCGVGRKVADCVGLFSLEQQSAIPVDVHVWNIARRDYDPDGTLLDHVKSLTPSIYKLVGDLFRSRFPNKPGWAHSLLFVAELPSFRPVLPDDMVHEMETFRLQEQAKKKKATADKKKNKVVPSKK